MSIKSFISHTSIFFIANIFNYALGQTYPIPGALQQPAWVFPVFFEDAIGQKDTIYLGYDGTSANDSTCYDEGFFNEEKLYHYFYDSTEFIVYTCLDVGPSGNDSIGKIEVTDFSNMHEFPIYVRNAYFPLKIKWDSSLLWGDSVPFPSVAGVPKAEVLLDWYFGNILPNELNCVFSTILVTDTCNYYCCPLDSMIFIEPFPTSVSISAFFNLTFRPWTGQIVGLANENSENVTRLFPNPVESGKQVKLTSDISFYSIEIYNIYGALITSKEILDNTFTVNNITPGIYFIQLLSQGQPTVSYKILIY